MNALTRLERMDDFFNQLVRRWQPMNLPTDLPQDIRLNVSETDSEYVVKAEVPGVKKEDLRVSVDGNTLTIAAETKHESEKKEGERVLMREMTQGSVARSLTLGYEIDDSGANAKFEDGVLELKLPKRKESRGRTIAVQ